jgi:hypothetical protein
MKQESTQTQLHQSRRPGMSKNKRAKEEEHAGVGAMFV